MTRCGGPFTDGEQMGENVMIEQHNSEGCAVVVIMAAAVLFFALVCVALRMYGGSL